MMPRFRLSPRAKQDLEAILAWTEEQFGEQPRLRYEELLFQAILDVAADPNLAGRMSRSELAPGAFTYHLRHSREHVSRSSGRVGKPRHFLLYRFAADNSLEIGRILHESMDLVRQLPPEYQSDAGGSAE